MPHSTSAAGLSELELAADDAIAPSPLPQVARQWCASIDIELAQRAGRTALMRARHKGPLRIQRLFYPEANGCAHVYLLHPPGGLVVGDELTISLRAAAGAHGLLTTPSAGKIYTVNGLRHSDAATTQTQSVRLMLDAGSVCEWLPQETIVFNGANARLNTRVDATADAKFCLWDIVCLGRPASQERFTEGRVEQILQVSVDHRPVLIERNRIDGRDPIMQAPWGLKGAGSFGTLVASVTLNRDQVDVLLETLHERWPDAKWGLTQKKQLFIARYLGASAAECRFGFIAIWQALRPIMLGCEALEPRIWNT